MKSASCCARNRNRIQLHADTRRTRIAMASFAVLSFLLLVGVVSSSGSMALSRLIALWNSDYAYSTTLRESIGRDDYYQFDAGIGFTRSEGSNRGIHADVLMQTADSDYTASVSWNVERLGTFEVAISEDVARAYGLRAGDRLHSKHIVDGTWHEYTVRQLLPCATGLHDSEGVIVMGYDGQYVENISHEAIIFTSEAIEDLAERYSEVPLVIAYRDDEIAAAVVRFIPPLLVLVLFTGVLTFLFAYNLALAIWGDYRRRIMLGFGRRGLKRAYWLYIGRAYLLAVLPLALLSGLTLLALRYGPADMSFLSTMLLTATATMVAVAALEDERAWRS